MNARIGICAAAVALQLAGCAAPGGAPLEDTSPGVVRGRFASPANAQALLHAGNTKADVAAALGAANVIAFDSGWEVWVYRWPGADRTPRSASELVLLFDASGALRKSRIRQGSPAASG